MVALVGAVFAAGSFVAARQAVATARGDTRRESLALAAELHRDLTTGEVAKARHVIGSKMYGNLPQRSAVADDVMESYYILLWAFERLAAGVEVLRKANHHEALALLLTITEWHAKEIDQNIRRLKADSGLAAADDSAFRRFEDCARTVGTAGTADAEPSNARTDLPET
ncbi:hypothetical protein ABZ413_17325 [Nocardia rhamnosiphila]|uniref:hypothetical protein n=1 Tax=Nocardia rhamnosiphila TaxID=426716 RepID=UPI0033D8E136